MQNIKQIKVGEIKECADCEYLYLCGTGCRKIAFSTSGSLYAKDKTVCKIYSFFHKKIMPLLNQYNINFITP